jgi:hypothetical protein
MKWFKRIARESVGCCRGAAIDHSPGLQPWVRQIERSALKALPTRYAGAIRTEHTDKFQLQTPTNKPSRGRGRRRGRERCASRVAPDVRAIGELNTPFAEHTPRSPLSGRGRVGAFPRAKALGYSLRPFHGQELPESVNVSNH